MMLDSPVVEELIGFANEELKNATSNCLVSKNCDLNSFFSFSGAPAGHSQFHSCRFVGLGGCERVYCLKVVH